MESAVPLVPLGLAVDAAGRLRAGLQPPFRDRPPAIRARPVAAVLDPGQRGHDFGALRHRRGQDGLGPVTFGQAGPGVDLVLGKVLAGGWLLTAQHLDRLVELRAGIFQPLAYGKRLHKSSMLVRGAGGAAERALGASRAREPQNNVPGAEPASGSIRPGPLCRTELTSVDTGYDVRWLTAAGASSPCSASPLLAAGSSQSAQRAGSITIGIRSWICPISSSARVVMIVADHSQARGSSSGTLLSRHSSYRPAKASTPRSSRWMKYGCF